MKDTRWIVVSLTSLVVVASVAVAQDSTQGTAQDPVAALKQSLAASKTALKQYEWIEATTTLIKGEDKGTRQVRCYHDAEGTLTKVETGGGEKGRSPGGLRGKAAAKKKEEMSAAVKQATALLESYFPLDPALLQKAKDEGRFAVRPADASGRIGFDIKSYKKLGDQVSIDLNANAMQLMKVSVSSYNTAMDKDAVSVQAEFKTLPDGTTYEASKTLEIKSEALVIKVATSGYKKT